MRIIAVANQKGGCGKTTTAINLSACLAANNKKVLLIDLDPQSHATLGLNVQYELSIYNVLSKLTNKKARIEDIIRNIGNNFDIVPSSIVLSTLEQELAGEISRESVVNETLKNLKNNYDYVLIDCPPNLGILTINAIRAAEEVIIPVEASRFSLEGLTQIVDIINLIEDKLNHSVNHSVLVTNFDSRLRYSFKVLSHIRLTFKEKVFSNIIHVNVKLKEAQSQGMDILNYDKYCRGTKDYFSLAREIITGRQASDERQMSIIEKRMKEALKVNLPKLKLKECIFSVSAPEAKEVRIVGDFNAWRLDDQENNMMPDNNGVWRKKINLNPGKYHYRFVIDGVWREDPNNPIRITNPFGEMNSLVEIE